MNETETRRVAESLQNPDVELVMNKEGDLVEKSSISGEGEGTKMPKGSADMFMDLEQDSQQAVLLFRKQIDELINRSNLKPNGPILCSMQAYDDCSLFKLDELNNGNQKALFVNLTNGDIASILNKHKNNQERIIILINIKEDESLAAYICENGIYKLAKIIIPPLEEDLFSRVKGIYETNILSHKKVLIIGLGSGGSPIALELVKQGVQNIILVDHDRLEVANVSRHICGLDDLGRYKTKAVADILKNKNPYANIITHESDITKLQVDFCNSLFKDVDLVICGTDNRASKQFINGKCIEFNKVCIYGGAFRRAYGGQVLRIIPYETLCYECFISMYSKYADDNEVSRQSQIDNLWAYDDGTFANITVEPGLSTDILPISTLMTKLAILELLRGQNKHILTNQYDDFTAAFYLWLNKREADWEQVLPAWLYNQ